MTRNVLTVLGREIGIYAVIAVQMISGIVAGLLLIGLVPGDGMDFNVLGSLVLGIPAAVVFGVVSLYRNRIDAA